MGILNFFAKPPTTLMSLPRGSFTIDREGRVLASTLPQSFPNEFAEEIGMEVIAAFKDARAAKLVLGEFVVHDANLKLTARELRGGAIIFLVPLSLSGPPS